MAGRERLDALAQARVDQRLGLRRKTDRGRVVGATVADVERVDADRIARAVDVGAAVLLVLLRDEGECKVAVELFGRRVTELAPEWQQCGAVGAARGRLCAEPRAQRLVVVDLGVRRERGARRRAPLEERLVARRGRVDDREALMAHRVVSLRRDDYLGARVVRPAVAQRRLRAERP